MNEKCQDAIKETLIDMYPKFQKER
jgi:hypothetical protein